MLSLISHRAVVLFAVFAAAVALALSSIGNSSALTIDSYKTALEKAGYKVTADGTAVDYKAVKDGTRLVIEKDGKKATVVIINYGSIAELRADWTAENGKAPKAKAETKEFDGLVVYWNNDSVLVVDYANGNDSKVAQTSASVFLGPGGVGGDNPTPAPPKTGNGGLDGDNGSSINVFALLAAAGLVAAGAGALAVRRAR